MKHLLRSLFTLPRRVGHFVQSCWRDCPKHMRCSTLAASALLNLMLASFLLHGCASTPAGISKEQKIYSTATNVVAALQSTASYLPVQVASPVEIILGAVSAGLAAWNVHQQRTLKSLKKSNSAGQSASGLAAGSTPAAQSPTTASAVKAAA